MHKEEKEEGLPTPPLRGRSRSPKGRARLDTGEDAARRIAEAEEAKRQAVANENYEEAVRLKKHIEGLKRAKPPASPNTRLPRSLTAGPEGARRLAQSGLGGSDTPKVEAPGSAQGTGERQAKGLANLPPPPPAPGPQDMVK